MSVIVLFVLTLLIAALVFNRLRPVLAFMGALGVFVVLDYISLQAALVNVVNPSLVTLMLLITVSLAVQKTPFVAGLGDRLLNTGYRAAIGRLFVTVSSASALVNNTAVVASLINTVRQNPHFPASKVLLPLSYASIFGGSLTLIGSSTNMIVNSLVVQNGLEPMDFFTFTPLGLVMAAVGGAVLVLLGQYVLPDRKPMQGQSSHYFIEAVVSPGSPLVGKSITDNGLRQLGQLFLVEVVRHGRLISPVNPCELLEANDVLVFSGDVQSVQMLNRFDGLTLFDKTSEGLNANLVEAFISHQSILVGQTIRDINFRTQFDAAVVAIRRGDQRLGGRLGSIRLRTGDSLVLAIGSDFHQRPGLQRDFYLVSGVQADAFLSNRESTVVLATFVCTLLLAMLGAIPLMEGLFLLLGGYIASGVLSLEEIRRRFPFEMLAIVTATLGIAQVIISTGTATVLADGIVTLSGGWGVMGSLVGVFLLTLLFTEVINNNAAAALTFPIALAMAEHWSADPLPFIVAIIFGASASFVSPFGYQTNLMVYSAGNYRVKDYVCIGLPLSIIYSLVALNLIPVFFPF